MVRWLLAIWRAGLAAAILCNAGAGLAHAQITSEGNGILRTTGSWRVSVADGDEEDYTFFAVRSTGEARFPLEQAPFYLANDPFADSWLIDIRNDHGISGECLTRASCPPALWLVLTCPTTDLCILYLEESQPDPGEPIDDAEIHFERACVPALSPASRTDLPAAGGDGVFTVNIAANCDWTARSDNPSWPVSVSPTSGRGNFAVRYQVGANSSGVRQTFRIVVDAIGGGSAVFTIGQLGAPALRWSAPAGQDFGEVVLSPSSPPTKTVVLTNIGTTPVTLSSIQDCPGVSFTVRPNQPFTIPQGGSVAFQVEFIPRSLGPLECAIYAPEDPGARILLRGTGVLTRTPLNISLNASSFAVGQTMAVTAALAPLSEPRPVDAYIVVSVPGGQFLSLQLGGQLVAGIVPIARGFVPSDIQALLAQYTFNGAEPRGTYTWYAVLTEPGTLNFVSPLRQTSFTVP